MLGERHSERDERLNSNSARRPESANSKMLGNNDEDMDLNHREMGFGDNGGQGHNSASVNSNVEISKLSNELNSRLSREMDEMMTSVNEQIQRALSAAISNQVLPQIQNALKSGSGHLTRNMERSGERPEIYSEDNRYGNTKENLRNDPIRDRPNEESTDQAFDNT